MVMVKAGYARACPAFTQRYYLHGAIRAGPIMAYVLLSPSDRVNFLPTNTVFDIGGPFLRILTTSAEQTRHRAVCIPADVHPPQSPRVIIINDTRFKTVVFPVAPCVCPTISFPKKGVGGGGILERCDSYDSRSRTATTRVRIEFSSNPRISIARPAETARDFEADRSTDAR